MKSLFLTGLLVLIAACSHNEANRDIANVKAKEGVRTITKHVTVKVTGGLAQATHTLYGACAREAIKNDAKPNSFSLDILNFKDGVGRRQPSDLEGVCTFKENAQRRCPERSLERGISCTRSERRVEYIALDGCPTATCVKRDRTDYGSCPPTPRCYGRGYPVQLERYSSNGCPQYRCEQRACPAIACPPGQIKNSATCACGPRPQILPVRPHPGVEPVTCPAVECRRGQTKVPGRNGSCPVCI